MKDDGLKFNPGDRVFHRNLKEYGTFVEYDKFSCNQDCYVRFDNEDDPDDVRCVSALWLDRAIDENKLHLFSQRNHLR